MIVKLIPSRSAVNSCRYIWKPGSLPIGTNMASVEPEELAREFRFIHQARPVLRHQVIHLILALPPGEHLQREQWEASVLHSLKGLGYGDCAWTARAHTDCDHEHVHVLVSPLDFEGKRIDRGGDRYKCCRIGRELEARFGLQPTVNQKLPKRLLPPILQKLEVQKPEVAAPQPGLAESLRAILLREVQGCRTFADFADRLRLNGVEMVATVSQAGKVTGLGYRLTGEARGYLKASEIHESFTFVKLQKKHHLAYDEARDLAHMRPGAPIPSRKDIASLLHPPSTVPRRVARSMVAIGRCLLAQRRPPHAYASQESEVSGTWSGIEALGTGYPRSAPEVSGRHPAIPGTRALRRGPRIGHMRIGTRRPGLLLVGESSPCHPAHPGWTAGAAGVPLPAPAQRVENPGIDHPQAPPADGHPLPPAQARARDGFRPDLAHRGSDPVHGGGNGSAPAPSMPAAWHPGPGGRLPGTERTRIPRPTAPCGRDAFGCGAGRSFPAPGIGSNGPRISRVGGPLQRGSLCGRALPWESWAEAGLPQVARKPAIGERLANRLVAGGILPALGVQIPLMARVAPTPLRDEDPLLAARRVIGQLGTTKSPDDLTSPGPAPLLAPRRPSPLASTAARPSATLEDFGVFTDAMQTASPEPLPKAPTRSLTKADRLPVGPALTTKPTTSLEGKQRNPRALRPGR